MCHTHSMCIVVLPLVLRKLLHCIILFHHYPTLSPMSVASIGPLPSLPMFQPTHPPH